MNKYNKGHIELQGSSQQTEISSKSRKISASCTIIAQKSIMLTMYFAASAFEIYGFSLHVFVYALEKY